MSWMEVAWHGINVIMILGLVSLVVRLILGVIIANK